MVKSALLESTGDELCDQIVSGVLGAFEVTFPGRVLCCYLRGSRARGAEVAGSDLDLYIVFKDRFADRAEAERAEALNSACAQISPVVLETLLIGENRLYDNDALEAALDIRLAARLLYGADLRSTLPAFDAPQYVRCVIHTPCNAYSLPDERPKPLTYPLNHIDPTGEFYGFDRWQTPGFDEVRSTKLLVATVCWTATALVALRAGIYVGDKAASARLYLEHVGDHWAGLVTDVHDYCRDSWGYQVPTTDSEREALRSLCDQALGFQNHFLMVHRDYQLAELASGDAARQLLALERLNQIVFPDDRDVLDAFAAVDTIDDERVRAALTAARHTYEQCGGGPTATS